MAQTASTARRFPTRTYGKHYSYRKAAVPNLRVGDDVEMVVIPADFDHRLDRMGRPYAWTRGQILVEGRLQVRTVMIHGETYAAAKHLLGVGASITLMAHRERIVDRNTGGVGAEIVAATGVVAVRDREGREICGETGRVVEGHDRKGHYRTQRHGPGNSLTKVVWIADTVVNGGARLAA